MIQMTESSLGFILKEMYESSLSKKEGATSVHLFGIKYGNEIRDNGLNIKEIVKASGLPKSYNVEVNKGINLRKYVNLVEQAELEYLRGETISHNDRKWK